MKTPYKLSKDYEKLYDLVMEYECIPAYFPGTLPPFSVRHGHVLRDDISKCFAWSVDGFDYCVVEYKKKDLFLKECQRLNVEFIEP
jgi:hypothetical protein